MQWSTSSIIDGERAFPSTRSRSNFADRTPTFFSRPPSTSSSTSTSPSPSSPPPPYEDIHLVSKPIAPFSPLTLGATDTDSYHSNADRSATFGATRYRPSLSLPGWKYKADTTISGLREALDSLDTQMASLLSQRQELESRLEQAVRSQSPIFRLPEELLSLIFVTGVCNSGDEDPLLVSSLLLVCRYWRDVAVNTPELWSTICVGPHDSLEKTRRRLVRSKSVPLDVAINFSPRVDNPSAVTENIVRAMDLLQPALWRTRSFRLSVPNRPQAHAALLRCREDATFLETLSICVHHSMQDDHHTSPCLPLFNGYTPRLKSCSFTSFNFGWDRRILSGLSTLHLGGYWNGFSPSADTLLDILRGCPNLHELTLRNMSDIDPEIFMCQDQEFSAAKVVKLPQLTKASFYYAGNMRTRLLLSQISFPALEYLDLGFLDNLTPVLEHLRQQSLTSLPLRHLRIESGFFNENKFINLLKRLMSLTTLELVDIEDVSFFFLKVWHNVFDFHFTSLTNSLTVSGRVSRFHLPLIHGFVPSWNNYALTGVQHSSGMHYAH
ncbi:hypothetical protein ID866_7729 [Astraeus odoratus]|nr:hypothetical protein ID866_7729 [Astraeus odoratus]